MEGGASWCKSLSLSIILSTNVTHKLAHAVSMIVGWLKGMLGDKPSWREDHKVKSCRSALGIIYPSIADLHVRTVKMEGSG